MEPFYVGKGSGNRAYTHLKGYTKNDNPHFYNKIQKMLREGIEPKIKITNTKNEIEAYNFEIELIKKIGRKDKHTGSLLNLTDGGENPPNPIGQKRPDVSKRMKENNPMKRPEVVAKFIDKKRPDHSTFMKENNPKSWLGKFGENHHSFGKPRPDLVERNKLRWAAYRENKK